MAKKSVGILNLEYLANNFIHSGKKVLLIVCRLMIQNRHYTNEATLLAFIHRVILNIYMAWWRFSIKMLD